MQTVKNLLLAIVLWTCSNYAISQVAQLSAAEIEKRNAAAAFAISREVGVFTLLGECGQLMNSSNLSMQMVPSGWFDRNKLELEAAYVWLDQYLSYLKGVNPIAFNQASTALVGAAGYSALQNARVFFSRKIPDFSSCEKAARTYTIPQLDFKSMALNPGYEQFLEFPQTLIRIRSEPNFSVPSHLKFGLDSQNQKLAGIGNIASLDAAEAAKERGDGPGRVAAFKNMAQRGDGQAAHQIGVIYLNGNQVDKNYVEAYRWFYAAWALSEMEGLNALGVMHRDGLWVPVNTTLAQSAFYLAKAAARNQAAFDRALNNIDQLAGRISSDVKTQIACTTLTDLDNSLREPINMMPAVAPGKSIESPQRRLGSVVKDFSASFQLLDCQ